jgi:hypothetical protein
MLKKYHSSMDKTEQGPEDLNFARAPKNIQRVCITQMATEILNISGTMSVAWPKEFLLGQLKL